MPVTVAFLLMMPSWKLGRQRRALRAGRTARPTFPTPDIVMRCRAKRVFLDSACHGRGRHRSAGDPGLRSANRPLSPRPVHRRSMPPAARPGAGAPPLSEHPLPSVSPRRFMRRAGPLPRLVGGQAVLSNDSSYWRPAATPRHHTVSRSNLGGHWQPRSPPPWPRQAGRNATPDPDSPGLISARHRAQRPAPRRG